MTTQNISIDYTPRAWQSECHKHKKRFRIYALHRRAGKTNYACMELINDALATKMPNALFTYVAPFLKQAKAVMWPILKMYLKPLVDAKLAVFNEGDLYVTFKHNGAIIRIFGGDNPDAMRGLRLDGVVGDELAQWRPELWFDVLQPALSDRKGWFIGIGTPNGLNLFSELFFKGERGEEGWLAKRYTVYETNALDPEEVSRLKRDMSEVSFSREYLCDFDAAGVNQLISLALIEESVRRIYKPGQFDYQAKIIGIDPARYGDDLSTIVKRQGLCCFEPISFAGLDNMALADQVVYHIETWKPDAVFCDAGNGAGVIDRIRQLGHSVIEVPFGGASTNPKYANKRAQMWGDMAQWLKDGGQLPDHPRLKADLAGPTYWFDQKGRMMLEPKSEMKARGLPSPDFGDALCTTFAATVMPKKHEVPRWSGNSLHASEYVYDPRRF